MVWQKGREGKRVALKIAQDFIRSATDSCSLGPLQLLDSWSAAANLDDEVGAGLGQAN